MAANKSPPNPRRERAKAQNTTAQLQQSSAHHHTLNCTAGCTHKKVSSLPVKKSPLGPRLGGGSRRAGRKRNGQSSGSSGSSSLCSAVLCSPPEFGDQWKRKKNSIDFLAIKIPPFLPPSIVPPGTDGCLFLGRPSSDPGERRQLGLVVLPAQQLRQSSARPAAGSGGRRR